MATLRQLLANHGHLLVLDAASAQVQAGVLAGGRSWWQRPAGDPGRALFEGATAALRESGTDLAAIGAFVYCEGPGSMLGLRTAAMALRTWRTLGSRPAYAYQSLAVAATHAWQAGPARAFTVIADARREAWHAQAVGADGRLAPLARLAAAGLPAGELLSPGGFRAWSEPPRPVHPCSYDLARVFAALADAELFRAVEEPDVFQHEAPEYRRWTATVHSAESAARPARAGEAPRP